MPKPHTLAQATWQDLIGERHKYLAAVMRGNMEDAAVIREDMHLYLEAYLDRLEETVVADGMKARG